jgi:hypothetical protein
MFLFLAFGGTAMKLEDRATSDQPQEPADTSTSAGIKSRILEKIKADMQRGDEPGMLQFDSGGGHSRYTSG